MDAPVDAAALPPPDSGVDAAVPGEGAAPAVRTFAMGARIAWAEEEEEDEYAGMYDEEKEEEEDDNEDDDADEDPIPALKKTNGWLSPALLRSVRNFYID